MGLDEILKRIHGSLHLCHPLLYFSSAFLDLSSTIASILAGSGHELEMVLCHFCQSWTKRGDEFPSIDWAVYIRLRLKVSSCLNPLGQLVLQHAHPQADSFSFFYFFWSWQKSPIYFHQNCLLQPGSGQQPLCHYSTPCRLRHGNQKTTVRHQRNKHQVYHHLLLILDEREVQKFVVRTWGPASRDEDPSQNLLRVLLHDRASWAGNSSPASLTANFASQ